MLHHVGLTVSDLDTSVEFYCAVLGCTVIERSRNDDAAIATLTGLPGASIASADLALPGGGGALELVQYVSPVSTPLMQEPNQPGHTHIAFLVDDVDAAYDRLVASGGRPTSRPVTIAEPGSAWDGVRALYARDPDGRTIECLEWRLR